METDAVFETSYFPAFRIQTMDEVQEPGHSE
jgi:hypothetical protein